MHGFELKLNKLCFRITLIILWGCQIYLGGSLNPKDGNQWTGSPISDSRGGQRYKTGLKLQRRGLLYSLVLGYFIKCWTCWSPVSYSHSQIQRNILIYFDLFRLSLTPTLLREISELVKAPLRSPLCLFVAWRSTDTHNKSELAL